MENTFRDCFFLPSTEELLPPSLPLVAQNDQASASMSTEELLQPARNLEEQAFDSDGRFYAFEKAHKLDPTSTGPGVRQFKTPLIQRLERTEKLLPLWPPLVAKNDQASDSKLMEELLPPPSPSLPLLQRSIGLEQPAGNLEEGAFEVVPSSLFEIITPILRVANEVEPINSRVAYLCRFYAFEKAHKLDPTSSERGVRQFKTALLQQLERDDSQSCLVKGTNSDAREMQSFYRHFTTTYIPSLKNSADKAHSAKLTKANQIAGVIFEVLKPVNRTESIETDHETEKLLPLWPPLVAKNDQASDSKLMEELLPPPSPSLPLLQCSIGLEQPAGNLKEGAFEVVPSSLFEIITPVLRVANEVEPINSRVAYLCRFYAFEKAHKLDPTSSERGVRQFKTALLRQLERDDSQSCLVRGTNSDAREMQSFYRHFTSTYIPSLKNSADKAHSAKLTKANQTAGVIFEVLKYMNLTDSIETDHENLKSNVEELPVCDIEEKMMATDEKRQPPSPPVVAKNYAWDYFFPAEEVLNPPLPLDSENDQ